MGVCRTFSKVIEIHIFFSSVSGHGKEVSDPKMVSLQPHHNIRKNTQKLRSPALPILPQGGVLGQAVVTYFRRMGLSGAALT